jgi:transketolase
LLVKNKNKPHVIIANTIKGKGIKFMENSILWHYKSPDNKELSDAIKELK